MHAKVRKVQIRFQNDTHSSQVVDILKELGYLVEEITGPPPSRLLASSASATLSSSSASKIADYPPNAPVRLSSAIASTALPNDGRSSVLSSSASSHEFKVPVRPATSESHRDSFRDSFSSSQRLPVQLSAPMTNSEFGAPVSLSRSGSFHEPVNSLYLSQIERQVRPHIFFSFHYTVLTFARIKFVGCRSQFRKCPAMEALTIHPTVHTSLTKCNQSMKASLDEPMSLHLIFPALHFLRRYKVRPGMKDLSSIIIWDHLHPSDQHQLLSIFKTA